MRGWQTGGFSKKKVGLAQGRSATSWLTCLVYIELSVNQRSTKHVYKQVNWHTSINIISSYLISIDKKTCGWKRKIKDAIMKWKL